MNSQRILVHVCCAPDGAYVLRLLKENFEPTAFFYNPNIYPPQEYDLRFQETLKVATWLEIPLIEEKPDFDRWFQLTKHLKDEKEMGRRCDLCYAMRLEKTVQRAAAEGFPFFTTVMSLSPWKKSQTLNTLGGEFSRKYGINFLQADFKKKDGFSKSVDLSRKLSLYRQDYCGCLYSYQERQKRKAKDGEKR